MPDPQQKLVLVPEVGVVAFPPHMDDDSIVKAIRKHKGKTHDIPRPGAGLSTEESERTRQTKDAQPLSSAIPKWATDPLLPKVTSAGNAVDDFLTRGASKEQREERDRILREYDAQHPVQAGVNQGLQGMLSGASTPVGLATAALLPESKILSGIFAGQAAYGAYKDAKEAQAAYSQLQNPDAFRRGLDILMGRKATDEEYQKHWNDFKAQQLQKIAERATTATADAAMASAAGAHALPARTPRIRATGEVLPPEAATPTGEPLKPSPGTVEGKASEAPNRALKAPQRALGAGHGLQPVEATANQGRSLDAVRKLREEAEKLAPAPVEPPWAHPEYIAPEPGTRPIPPNSVRLFHYTHPSALDSIRQQGLLKAKGRGDDLIGSGASAGVWASSYAPSTYDLHERPYVEYYATPDQISRNANYPEGQSWTNPETNRYERKPPTQADLDEWAKGHRHAIMGGDVPPSQILDIHEPWMDHARYFDDNWKDMDGHMRDPAYPAELRDKWNSPHEAKALEYVQKKNGIASIQPVEDTQSLKYNAVDQTQPFYLKSEKLLGDKMKGPMPATDIGKMLASNGIKPEEMKWTGLDKFLESKGNAKVAPQEIQDFIAQNDLQIKEVGKESDQGNLKSRLVGQYKQFVWRAEKELGIQADKVADEIEAGGDPEAAIRRFEPNPSPELLRAGKDLHEVGREVERARQAGPTKYGSYVLPGGTSYREMLVTMPPRMEDSSTARSITWSVSGQDPTGAGAIPQPASQDQIRQMRERGFTVNDLGPEKVQSKDNFKSSHWDEPNILGHIRFNDRVGPNGEHILHVEELQSDLHQKGRSQGYQGDVDLKAMRAAYDKASRDYQDASKDWDDLRKKLSVHEWNDTLNTPEGKADYAAMQEAQKRTGEALKAERDASDAYDAAAKKTPVPDMPFKKTWPELLLKRITKYAADNGYDGISWSPGDVQSERYDLSKQVEAIRANKNPDGTYQLGIQPIGERMQKYDTAVPADKLEDHVGKDLAHKIVSEVSEPGVDKGKIFSGLDLKVGGSGMRGFYDQIIPAAANKLGKQWGAKVGTTRLGEKTGEIEALKADMDAKEENLNALKSKLATLEPSTPGDYSPEYMRVQKDVRKAYDDYDAAVDTYKEAKTRPVHEVPYLPITPEMRGSGPLPLFNLIYRSPSAPPEIKAKLDRGLSDIDKELSRIPKPNPMDYDPSNRREWTEFQRQKDEYEKRAKTWLDARRQVREELEKAEQNNLGQIRQQKNGGKIIYLNRRGLTALRQGMKGKLDIDMSYSLNGASLNPHNVAAIYNNLGILKGPGMKELQNMLITGSDKNGIVTVSMMPEKGMSLRELLNVQREELNHGWQKAVADQFDQHLTVEQYQRLNDAIPEAMRDYLNVNGYADNDGSHQNSMMRVLEASSKLLSATPDRFGMTEDEAAQFLFQYWDAVENKHGKDALDSLVHTTVKAKEIKNDYFNATGRPQRLGNQKDSGDVPSVQDRGVSRTKGTDAQEKRGGSGVSGGAGSGAGPELNQKSTGAALTDVHSLLAEARKRNPSNSPMVTVP